MQVDTSIDETAGGLREDAIRSLKKKRDFQAHLLAYVLVNAVLWGIWAVIAAASGAWFPWPIFATLGWGIGMVFHVWDVYGRGPFTEEDIQREEARLRGT